jgi:hypothetical protein
VREALLNDVNHLVLIYLYPSRHTVNENY